MLQKGVIKEFSHEEGEFISPIIPVPKPESSSYQMILKLKWLNDFMLYMHFKIETINSILNLIITN